MLRFQAPWCVKLRYLACKVSPSPKLSRFNERRSIIDSTRDAEHCLKLRGCHQQKGLSADEGPGLFLCSHIPKAQGGMRLGRVSVKTAVQTNHGSNWPLFNDSHAGTQKVASSIP